jgi:class 3 adenylate cyclase
VHVPDVNFVDAAGARIAWQQWGSGPDVLAVPPLVSNVELLWEHEFYRRFMDYVGRHVRVTSFDKRGIGLSDKVHDLPTLEQRASDITAVMDAAGVDRPAVVGVSEGGLMAQLFTVLHPARVDRLVLVNSHPGASGWIETHRAADGSLDLRGPVERAARLVDSWGRDPQFFVDWFCPSHSHDVAFVRWMGRLQRQSATSGELRRQLESLRGLDAVDQLAQIQVPTLVIKSTGDAVVPAAAGRYLADRIPGALLHEVSSPDHFMEATPDWQSVADRWLEFVTGSRPSRRAERRMATVLFTDIVGSTAAANAVGDAAWRALLDRHDRSAWESADRHGGRIVKNTGDGLLARFDSPSAALDFAVEHRQALAELGLRIRCGVHAGEVELRADGDISGAAVNLAARVMDAAADGAILVSSTVRELLFGGELGFEDRGEHALKGFDSRWRLYELRGEPG